MGKITGFEDVDQIPQKVLQIYKAVFSLLVEGTDITNLRVSTITERAGIGKGTAYEYFDTKEDIVSCAIVYHTQVIFGELSECLMKMNSFLQQLDYLLEEIGKPDGKRYCLLKFIHMLTDQSECSILVQKKLKSKKAEQFMPVAVFGRILQRAVERGELRKDLPLDYMVYTLFSHLLTYLLVLATEDSFGVSAHSLVSFARQGILNELCEKNE